MGILETALRGVVKDNMGKGPKKYAEGVCLLVRILGGQPLVGTEIIHFFLTSRPYRLEDGGATDPPDEEAPRLTAQKACLGIIAGNAKAATDLEGIIAQYLQRNQALIDDYSRRSAHTR